MPWLLVDLHPAGEFQALFPWILHKTAGEVRALAPLSIFSL